VSDAPKQNTLRTLSYAMSGLGIALWIVHMVLKYAMDRPMPVLLWVALGLVLVAFAMRRSQGP
jgi:hypothetical protein